MIAVAPGSSAGCRLISIWLFIRGAEAEAGLAPSRSETPHHCWPPGSFPIEGANEPTSASAPSRINMAEKLCKRLLGQREP